MRDSFRIERLTPDHTDAFRALRLEALRLFPDFYGTDYADAVSTTLSTYARRIETGLLLGGFIDDKLAGCLAFDREEGSKLQHRGWITSVYVQPAHQRTGLGRAMLNAVLNHPLAQGLAQIELFVSETNKIGIKFYKTLGFGEVGRAPRALKLADGFVDELHMVLCLDG